MTSERKAVIAREAFDPGVRHRNRRAGLWRRAFKAATAVGIVFLAALLVSIVNDAFGYVAIENSIDPAALSPDGTPLAALPKDVLTQILAANVSKGLFRRFEHDHPFEDRTQEDVYGLVLEHVVEPKIVAQWTLWDSLTRQRAIAEDVATRYPDAELRFETWLDVAFITSPQSADAARAGVRTAILG